RPGRARAQHLPRPSALPRQRRGVPRRAADRRPSRERRPHDSADAKMMLTPRRSSPRVFCGGSRMTTSRVRCMLSVLSTTLLAAVVPVAAKPYPVNVCVSRKQEDAGDYCRRVLKAWAAWDRDQDSTRRDNKIAGAAADLGVGWAKAEAQSSTA